jgi:predicted cupin superfamily sugar epimerase
LVNGLYNISGLNNATGLRKNIMGAIFRDLAPYIANANGAYARYSDGTSTYAVWMQGTLNPAEVNLVVSSFNYNVYHTGANKNIAYAPLSNSISMCSYYSGGYTKIIELYNASKNETCMQMAQSSYSASESNALVQKLKSDKNLALYRSGFLYVNSTVLSSLLAYDGSNLSVSTLFGDQYGVFMSSIKAFKNSINLTSYNSTCSGLVYSTNGINVCSAVLPESNGRLNGSFGLVDSTYVTPHYAFNLYSIVATSNLLAAHYNAANLISRLLVNETSLEWKSRLKNACAFANSSIGCEFESFNASANAATIKITNGNYSSIQLTAINCEVSPGFPWKNISYTLQKGQQLNLSTPCHTLPLPGAFVLQTNYILGLNFTYNGELMHLNGTLNATT